MSKLNKKPTHQAQLSKSMHDLSHTFDFTSAPGMLLPLEHDVLNPGESIRCKVDLSQTRTLPLAQAAYLDLDLHVDYFFVPFDILFSNFSSFIYQVRDNFSSNFMSDGTGLPLLSMENAKLTLYHIRTTYPNPSGLNGLFDSYGAGAIRLLDHLGLGTLNTDTGQGVENRFYNPNVFPYQLLAYNAIYQYYYRLDDYEKLDNSTFNVDKYFNTAIPDSTTLLNRPWFELHYRPRYMDYFNSLKNSPIVSPTNIETSPAALPLAKNWLSRESYPGEPIITNGYQGASDNVTSSPNASPKVHRVNTNFGFQFNLATLGSATIVNGADINTANLRALFANEKLWTITGMSRKTYDAQTLAHFGFNVPTDVKHEVQKIGSHVYPLKVGEVISTAGTDNQPLATVAGKGYAYDDPSKEISFTAPCHGVFMAIYSASVRRNYCNLWQKHNAVATWQDFYQPEFDNLGMQPLFDFEAVADVFDDGSGAVNPFGVILGWQYRYEQFKRRPNRTTLAYINSAPNVPKPGPFSAWSVSEEPFYGATKDVNTSLSNTGIPSDLWNWVLKESPHALDDLMAVSYDGAWHESGDVNFMLNPSQVYSNDPLSHHAFVDYHKMSTMSAYSLPRLDG